MLELYNTINTDISVFDDPYSRALRFKSGNLVKYFDITKHFHLLNDNQDKKIIKFLIYNKLVYIIPLELQNSEIYAFDYKSVESKSFIRKKLLGYEYCPVVFGLNDIDRFDIPIIMIEGVKDCMAVKQRYKYCIAYLTSAPQEKLFVYLQSISKKLIFIPDNDKVGRKIEQIEKYKQNSKYYSLTKDFGDYFLSYDQRYMILLDHIIDKEGLDINGL